MNDEKRKAQIRASKKARDRATQRLIDMYPDEFRRYYVEEAALVGVTPKPHTGLLVKRHKKRPPIGPLIEQIRSSGVLDGVDLPERPDPNEDTRPIKPIIRQQSMTLAEQLDATFRAPRPVWED